MAIFLPYFLKIEYFSDKLNEFYIISFDDKGRQFDKDGNLKQWWNNSTIKRFRQRAQCIIDQYSSYVLEDIRMNVNGKMTQGLEFSLFIVREAFDKFANHMNHILTDKIS